MKKYLIVALLASLLAGCAHDSPCVPVYDSQGRLVHTNTCMKAQQKTTGTPQARSPGGRRGSRPHVRDRRADSLQPLIHPDASRYWAYYVEPAICSSAHHPHDNRANKPGLPCLRYDANR
jgi:hypothetical protein